MRMISSSVFILIINNDNIDLLTPHKDTSHINVFMLMYLRPSTCSYMIMNIIVFILI